MDAELCGTSSDDETVCCALQCRRCTSRSPRWCPERGCRVCMLLPATHLSFTLMMCPVRPGRAMGETTVPPAQMMSDKGHPDLLSGMTDGEKLSAQLKWTRYRCCQIMYSCVRQKRRKVSNVHAEWWRLFRKGLAPAFNPSNIRCIAAAFLQLTIGCLADVPGCTTPGANQTRIA